MIKKILATLDSQLVFKDHPSKMLIEHCPSLDLLYIRLVSHSFEHPAS